MAADVLLSVRRLFARGVEPVDWRHHGSRWNCGDVVRRMAGSAWLRRDHRALYLLSAISAGLTIPFAAFAFFGPRGFLLPAVFVAEFFLFLNTGPLNTAIVNSVAASVRSTAIALNLFIIHALGDASSPRIIGKISDHSSLRMGLGITLISLVLSCGILLAGSRFAPKVVASER